MKSIHVFRSVSIALTMSSLAFGQNPGLGELRSSFDPSGARESDCQPNFLSIDVHSHQ